MSVVREIVKANYHGAGPGILEIPHALWASSHMLLSELQYEAAKMAAKEIPSEASGALHATNWVGIRGRVAQWSLLNYDGLFNGTYADMLPVDWKEPGGKRFHHARRYPAMAEFLSLNNRMVNARINGMWPDSALSPHSENVVVRMPDGGLGLKLRFHLPLVTNPQATTMVHWKMRHLKELHLYYVHNGMAHASRNAGSTPRLHLVWDEILASESRLLLESGVEPEYSPYGEPPPYPTESCPVPEAEALEALQ